MKSKRSFSVMKRFCGAGAFCAARHVATNSRTRAAGKRKRDAIIVGRSPTRRAIVNGRRRISQVDEKSDQARTPGWGTNRSADTASLASLGLAPLRMTILTALLQMAPAA